ncbi:hypothetical protein LOAG_05725 [Loa loa]|uniref:Uncharacterized protein n=1 Tax=Loa loa TaxID=7209 RepID=A0A1S0TZX1_LOALO|nr:hypothetical protein LOAG_05725 [Loa loa]EFO22761.1 hypothetical protein LOAG_05725 [Loa loa]
MTSADVEQSSDSFERNQNHTAQPSVTPKNTTVMQDICSGGGNHAIDNNTIYTQQQITAMISDANCMYNQQQQLAATERSETMSAYHQDLTTELMPATTVANDHSDEQHYYTVAMAGSRNQQHFIHNDYTPSGLSQQQQMLMNARNATIAEKLPRLQERTCQFISVTGTDHNGRTESYVVVNQQSAGTRDYLDSSFSSGGGSIDSMVPCSKVTNSLVANAKQHEPQRVTCVFNNGSTNGMNRDIDANGTKLQRLYTSSRNVTLQGLQLARFIHSLS